MKGTIVKGIFCFSASNSLWVSSGEKIITMNGLQGSWGAMVIKGNKDKIWMLAYILKVNCFRIYDSVNYFS